MGSVANKIAKKIMSARKSNVIGLADWAKGKQFALECGFNEKGEFHEKFIGLQPCHLIYTVTQNFSSVISDTICEFKEAKGYVKIVSDAVDEYLPGGPPMSPLTTSYFTMWSMFDVQFGSSRETMGNCIIRISSEFDCPDWLLDSVERMQQSRMGFYVHCGFEDDEVVLREVGTQETLSCHVPSGYIGCEGQIWFVRVLPPFDDICHQHIVFNTPYVIRNYPESAFVDYLEREFARMNNAKRRLAAEDTRGYLMKYGPTPNHWNEYIFLAYSNHEFDVIFLKGIPDILKSLPHHARAYQ